MNAYVDFFYEKCALNEFWFQYCPHCRTGIFYPRGQCPSCLKSDIEWKKASGRATLHSYTVVYVSALQEFAGLLPYVYALVDLEEGVRIASNIVDCPAASLRVDMPLQMAWIQRDGRYLPVFKPA